jgi:hypothetical protein
MYSLPTSQSRETEEQVDARYFFSRARLRAANAAEGVAFKNCFAALENLTRAFDLYGRGLRYPDSEEARESTRKIVEKARAKFAARCIRQQKVRA